MTLPPEPEEPWRDPLRGYLPAPRVLDSYRPFKIHSEFHRLVLAWEEAVIDYMGLERWEAEAGYARLQMARKELYEWVRDNTAIPEPLYTIYAKFT